MEKQHTKIQVPRQPEVQQHVGNESSAMSTESGGFGDAFAVGAEASINPIQAAANGSPGVKQLMAYQASANAAPGVRQLMSLQASASQGPAVTQLMAMGTSAAVQSERGGRQGGLPMQLRAGIEELSGFDMGDVQVHYNSSQPAQFQAEAYAQGSEIHLAAGKEQHLPHEAWHVAQQKAGRVAPTGDEGGKAINTDVGLEAEADTMGAKAMQVQSSSPGNLQSGVGGAAKQFKRLTGGTLQFGKRKKRAAARLASETLRKNQEKIQEYHATLKAMGRANRDVIFTIQGLDADSLDAHDIVKPGTEVPEKVVEKDNVVPESGIGIGRDGLERKDKDKEDDDDRPETINRAEFYVVWQQIRKDAHQLKAIQIATGLENTPADARPVMLQNAIDAVGAATKAIRKKANALIPNIHDEIEKHRLEGDLMHSLDLLDVADDRVDNLRNDDEEEDEDELKKSITAAFKGAGMVYDLGLRCLPMSGAKAKGFLLEVLTEKRMKAFQSKYGKVDADQIANAIVLECATFKQTETYQAHEKQILQMSQKALRAGIRAEYHEMGAETHIEGITDLFDEMAQDIIPEQANDEDGKKFLAALKKRFGVQKGDGVPAVLHEAIRNHGDHIGDLFMDTPGLLDQCLAQVHEVGLHQTLVDIKQNGKSHSIKDINDYVGDKLSEPLMRWVMDKNIEVEVHAMSLMSSFAKLNNDGFTDIMEIPSDHTGTKKWIAINPVTKMAKVVFQTLPGQSYAIQTAGAFLFFEIYDFSDEIKEKIEVKGLKDDDEGEGEKIFIYPGYKARNVNASDEDSVDFILVSEDNKTFMHATVPYTEKEPIIGTQGEIILYDLPGDGKIEISEMDVRTLDQSKLSMFSENVDYVQLYIDTLQSYGIDSVDIACIGREGALTTELEKAGAKAKATIDQIHFKGKVYLLDGIDDDDDDAEFTLLTLSISPEFFGDKAGFLMKALKTLGVQHVSFVGTAGGLAPDSEVGQVMAPAKLANFANGKTMGGTYDNKAQNLLEELDGKDGVDMSDFKNSELHLGVHSPITESDDMIEAMKDMDVSSVDCEAGFMADALKGSNVSLYAFFFVGDVPGSQHSIGKGGTAGAVETGQDVQAPKTAATELAVLGMIKKAIKGEITNSDSQLQAQTYSIDKGGKVANLKYPGRDGAKANLKFDLVLPKSGQDGHTSGLVKNFGRQVNDIFTASGGIVTLQAQQAVNDLAAKFLSLYKIKFIVTFS